MAGITVTLEKDDLVIRTNVKKGDWKTSSTGKSQVITTGGFIAVEGGYKVGLNILKPKE